MEKIPVLVICGPTATGKTRLSVELSEAFSGEVVSADSVQIYKFMDIGSAKPTNEEKKGISHHMIDIVMPNENFNVSDYCRLAARCIFEIHERGKLPVLTGGTGMYIDSLIQGIEFFDIKNDYEYRKELSDLANEKGIGALYEMLLKIDRASAEKIDKNDKKRIIRALEIFHTTGKTKSYFVERSKLRPSVYRPLYIGLTYNNRELMYERIRTRVDEMIAAGLEFEVRNLMNIEGFLSSTAASGIGYKEMYDYINGIEDFSEAVAKIKQNSTRYAKRQLTWFRRNKAINWLCVDAEGGFETVIKKAGDLVSEFIYEK